MCLDFSSQFLSLAQGPIHIIEGVEVSVLLGCLFFVTSKRIDFFASLFARRSVQELI